MVEPRSDPMTPVTVKMPIPIMEATQMPVALNPEMIRFCPASLVVPCSSMPRPYRQASGGGGRARQRGVAVGTIVENQSRGGIR